MPKKRGLMMTVLGRMAAAGEALISDRHAGSLLVSFLGEADQVTDPVAAWGEVRSELASAWNYDDSPEGPTKPFLYQDGVAVIPVHGVLLNRFNWCWGFVTGYDFIRKQMNAAEADEDVRLIVFDHDTPGGEAAGCDELAREIKGLKTSTMALVNTSSCSGGYWLAAPCNRVVCAPSGSVGSIGVYIQHMNMKRMLEEYGIEVEYVKNGALKTAGNPYEPLDEAAREYLQAMVDERADEFFASVAEFRGVEVSVVKGTDARVMRPTEALALGLIDAAESPTTAVASFVAELANDNEDHEPTEDELEESSMAEMTSEERAAIAGETKARIKGIMTHDEAKGREGLAEHLAYNTDNTVEEAAAILKASPKAQAEEPAGDKPKDGEGDKPKDGEGDKPKDGEGDETTGDNAKGKTNFDRAMDNSQHPNVGPDPKTGGGGDEATSALDRILASQALATGRKPQAKTA